ncbi:MAG: flagellar filament capping protein FliD, partial [Vogesella sp.]|uniref:flagellar filament capping protein FliD n=1 Tax=Vogesella sp. TaxID=1904252 RepID=UPI003F2AA8F4
VKGTAGATAAAGTYVVNVTSLAAAQTLALTSYNGSTGKITSNTQDLGNTTGGDLSIAFGSGTTLNVTIGANASLQSISDAINAKGGDVTASVVNSGADGYKLALSSKKAGNDGAFSVTGGAALGLGFLDFDRGSTNAANLAKRTSAPSDAQFTVNGVAITASSNKVTEALTGLELNLYKTGTATVTVTRDDDAVIKNVQAFVDGFNKIKTQVDSMYKQGSNQVTDADGKVIGTAVRLDNGARMMMQDITSELSIGIAGVSLESGLGFLSQAGISIQKDGALKLDSEEFKKALNRDSAAVYKLFSNSNTDGYADRLNAKINKMMGPDGMVQVRTDSLNQQVTYEKQKQDQIQARLDMMQKRYLTQFSALDAALAKMKNQSSYMASMLG